ncbi:MAG: phosphatase PAP2-related protein [Bacteroidota bacterium]
MGVNFCRITIKHIKEIIDAWKNAFADSIFITKFIVSVILLAVVLFFLANYLPYNETRPGSTLYDPLLDTFEPIDLTWISFILIYGALIVGLSALAKYPQRILIAFQSYTLLASLRLITIHFLPLNAPPAIIPMEDPFVAFFGGGKTLLRDLFFSGHTSTMFLLALTAQNKFLKWSFVVCTMLIGAAILAQHVHYTIDVIAAPFFAYTTYRIARLINKKKKISV